MIRFKVGDRVRCVEGLSPHLEAGKIYTVTRVFVEFISVLEAVDTAPSPRGEWYPNRFELVNSAKPAGPIDYTDVDEGGVV